MATVDTLLHLVAQLGAVTERRRVAGELAAALGACALFAFTPHPDVRGRWIPAPGFEPTLPASRGWRELLARCAVPGVHHHVVAFPTSREDAPAIAIGYTNLAIVLVGATEVPVLTLLDTLAPLLASLLGAEATVVATRGELEVARQTAERAAILTRALDQARGDAERAIRVKDEFLAMLGHELRNPLAPIVTALQMMRLEGVHSRAQDVLERQVEHVLRLVDDLLDVSRITRGKVELRKERVELASIVQRALELTRPLLEQRRSALRVDVPAHGLCVEGDPARLAQVVSNLITNAAKYSDAGTGIEIVAERVGDAAQLRVVDHGIGIAADYVDRVFEHFVQVPQGIERARGGLGLGLAIVKSLVQLHGGTVRVASEGEGKGCTFSIALPTCDTPPLAAVPAPAAAPTPGPVHAARVLVVDDNLDAAELLGEVLSAYGHIVHVANSGPDALHALDHFVPEAALLDLGLPVMDGFELARELRARLPGIRLIALTGYGQPDDRLRTAAAGFDAHLTKPVSIADVTATIARLVG